MKPNQSKIGAADAIKLNERVALGPEEDRFGIIGKERMTGCSRKDTKLPAHMLNLKSEKWENIER